MEFPIDVGAIYKGERIRKEDTKVELGGATTPYKAELVQYRTPGTIKDNSITIKGPDIKDMKKVQPFGILIEIAGKNVTPDMEAAIERRIHDFSNRIEGFMHLYQRSHILCRLSTASFQKGFDSLKYLGQILLYLFKKDLPIEKMQVTFMTSEEYVKPFMETARTVYQARDSRRVKDQYGDFYGCTLCQSFAPTHVCIITLERPSLCSLNFSDAQAAAALDGPIFRVEKGELVNPEKFEYSGVNKTVKEKSLETERVWLHTMFGYPHTSCSFFEAIAFYIPEVQGIALVHRDFPGKTVTGVPFVALALRTGGGRQVDGFLGISVAYINSPHFLKTDGGWNRIVWMPQYLKEQVKDAIPKELADKIATEEIYTIDGLKQFLKEKDHPVTRQWEKSEIEKEKPVIEAEELEAIPISENVSIILKNVRIHADKMIIRRK